jgi:hypothetical protein
MFIGNSRSTRIRVETIREWLTKRMHSATRSHARFEDCYVMTELREFVTRDKSSHACAEDRDLLGRTTDDGRCL